MNDGEKGMTRVQVESLQALSSRDSLPCTYPWTWLAESNVTGAYTFCAWLNTEIGQAGKDGTDKLLSLWNSPRATAVRQSLVDNDIDKYCQKNCVVRNSDLDAFLGYESHEYGTFSRVFQDNLLKAAAAVYNRDASISHMPITLKLHPSNTCTIRCRMCKMDKDYKLEVGRQYFDGIKPLLPYLHELFVFGGEPFWCKDTRDIIFSEEIRRHGQLHISTVTNATLLDDDVIERLSDLRLGRFVFSLDGASPASYNNIRIGANFDKVLANVKRFMACRDAGTVKVKCVGTHFVIQARNCHEVEKFVDLAHSLGVRASFSLVGGSTELYPCMAEVREHVQRGIRRARELKMDYSERLLEKVRRAIPSYTLALRKKLIVNSVLGEKNVQRIKQFFDNHGHAKKIVKKLLHV
jgi:MoaA/NifB/PqqE/SkfB family radical SAM enzyme